MRFNIVSPWFTAVVVLFAGCGTPPDASRPQLAQATIPGSLRWEDATDAPPAEASKSPVYPFEAWRARKSGFASVIFYTDSTGQVAGIRCIESSDAAFGAATVSAVGRWRFPVGATGPFRLMVRYNVSEDGASIDWK